jgi:RNA polymerase primary sigma factor
LGTALGLTVEDSPSPVADLCGACIDVGLDRRGAPGGDEEVPRFEPPPLGPESRPVEPIDELVTRCLQDLVDDWERKGGALSYDDVTRMATKRGLNGLQLADVLDGLLQAGITPTGLQAPASGFVQDRDETADLDAVSGADRDILGSYLKEIGRYPLLWADDEVRLGRLISTGQEADAGLADRAAAYPQQLAVRMQQASQAGRRAHADLVRSNLRLVVSIARQSRYARSGVELIDRIQDGNLGLMRAADKFDYKLGYKFSTYATWWIRQSIERGIANQSRLIRLPVHFHDRLVRVLGMQRRLRDRYDHEPTLVELAGALQMDLAEVQAVLDWAQPTISLDSPAVTDGDLTLGDLLSAEADVDGRTDPVEVMLTAARDRAIEEAFRCVLDPRAAEVIRRRFGLGGREEQTLEEIGASFGVTRERIRQIETKALDALVSSGAVHPLYEYLTSDTKRAEAEPPSGWQQPEEKRRKKKLVPASQRAQVQVRPPDDVTETKA